MIKTNLFIYKHISYGVLGFFWVDVFCVFFFVCLVFVCLLGGK